MALVPLTQATHGNMRLRPISFEFAAKSPVVRALAPEILPAGANYPVVFLKENETFVPHIVLGLAQDENLYVADGQWVGNYIPALLRRYPFMLGKSSGNGDAHPVLVVDDAMLSADEGEPLFGPEGDEPQGPAADALKLLMEIEMAASHTSSIVKSLAEHDLIQPLSLLVKRGDGAPENLGGVFSVDEAKLNALPDDVFLSLRRGGGLAFAYGQILSLGQFPRLQARAAARGLGVEIPKA